MSERQSSTVTDAEMLGFVRDYVRRNDLADPAVSGRIQLGTSLAELGLDSISVAELLLGARSELVAQGRISPDSTLLELPALDSVGDLGGLLRTLEA